MSAANVAQKRSRFLARFHRHPRLTVPLELSRWIPKGEGLVNSKQSDMIKSIEQIVAAKRRKEQMILARSPGFIRRATTGTPPKLFVKNTATEKHALSVPTTMRWKHLQTRDGRIVLPNREYEQMLLLLDNPPPWTDFYLQMKAESAQVLRSDPPNPG